MDAKLQEDIQELRNRISKLEDRIERHIHSVHRAFPRNDLQEPDFDGHRIFHSEKKDEAKHVTEYKHTITNRLLQGIVGFLLMLVGMGAVAWIKGL